MKCIHETRRLHGVLCPDCGAVLHALATRSDLAGTGPAALPLRRSVGAK